jgi:beta-glucuronidase
MKNLSRRKLLQSLAAAGASSAILQPAQGAAPALPLIPASELATLVIPLDGQWLFTLARQDSEQTFKDSPAELDSGPWEKVRVPHTWQISHDTAAHQGTAYYRTYFQALAAWAGMTVRIEFEAVTHSATVWVNKKQVGTHERKGYTAFRFDISDAVKFGPLNALTVKVDNPFNTRMLPREQSFDWTVDGGIIRPVSLLVTPQTYIERVEVDATPLLDDSNTDLKAGIAQTELRLRAVVRNTAHETRKARVQFTIEDDDLRYSSFADKVSPIVALAPGATATLESARTTERMNLWHFDRPRFYRVNAELECDGKLLHRCTETFGVRKFEAKDGGFFLNGEHVRLMGVERMAGSHPDYGMTEPASWIEHDHNDLKELNCVFTRVHWQQDRRVLDYCDRHGILMQEEVPAWGPDTFQGMADEPAPAILENGLEQLREMIARDRNHPSIFAWGLCNEVNGQNPPAQKFIRRMAEEARRLDPTRLLTYASNSLQQTPEHDAAGELDFISWNEYYESWYGGDVDSVRRNLEAIHGAFPGKPIVVSEYGYCECAPDRTGGDARRIEILKTHTNVYREFDFVAGAIFFDYNDYRTHVGDKGAFVLKQRVHGVVDVYGHRKPSFEALRDEASPLAQLDVSINGRWIAASVLAGITLPSYTLEGYALRCIVYGFGDLPMEQHTVPLPKMAPGEGLIQEVPFETKNPQRIRVDVMRPTEFSARTTWWKP